MTATRLPVSVSGGSGRTQPICQALSAIACSIVLIATGWFSRFSVQASSHGAGQTRPVNSGKVVRRMQVARRPFPVAGVDEIVPVGDLVVHRAAGGAVAIGNAAIHAARRLLLQIVVVEGQGELAEVPHAIARELVLLLLPVVFEEACDLAHDAVCAPYSAAWSVRKRSISCKARRYSTGITFTNFVRMCGQSSRIALARAEPV